MSQLPKELEAYIQEQAPASVNNARRIIRDDFQRILKLNPITAAKILNDKYGFNLDPDRTAKDYGDAPVNNNYE